MVETARSVAQSHVGTQEQDTELVSFGIPKQEITQSVEFALSALMERIHDLTRELDDKKAAIEALETLVESDTITSLPNRRAFMRRLEWSVAMRTRHDQECSLLFIDINDFKKINDTYGHAAGDEAIRHVANILSTSFRGSDYVARLSGDEFVVLLYYAPLHASRSRAKYMMDKISATPFMWQSDRIIIHAAAGAYEVASGESAERALAAADAAMYEEKRRSKAQVA